MTTKSILSRWAHWAFTSILTSSTVVVADDLYLLPDFGLLRTAPSGPGVSSLVYNDTIISAGDDLDGVQEYLVHGDFNVLSGDLVTSDSSENKVRFRVANDVKVESGALLEFSGQGVHGGAGGKDAESSASLPPLIGMVTATPNGGDGGSLEIVALGAIQVDGQIKAEGANSTGGPSRGHGGAGGTISLIGAHVSGNGTLRTNGGTGAALLPSRDGADGIQIIGFNATSTQTPNQLGANKMTTREGPMVSNPFLYSSDNETPTIPGLDGGAEGFGLAPDVTVSASLLTNLANGDDSAVIIRMNAPNPFLVSGITYDFSGYDWIVFYNPTDTEVTIPRFGFDGRPNKMQDLSIGGLENNSIFGGDARPDEMTSLGAGEVYLTLIPESVTTVAYSGNGITRYADQFANNDVLVLEANEIDIESATFDTTLNLWQIDVSGLDSGQDYHLGESTDCLSYSARTGSDFTAASATETLLVSMDSTLARAFLVVRQGTVIDSIIDESGEEEGGGEEEED